MKRIFLSLILLTSIMYAQEKEVKAFISDSGNPAKATAAKQQVESNSKLISPEVLAEYYYTNALKNKSNTDNLLLDLANLIGIEGKTYYYAKNKDSKKTEYYFSESNAKSAINGGNYSKLKSAAVPLNFMNQLATNPDIANLPHTLSKEANAAYDKKDYNKAAAKFLSLDRVLKVMGRGDSVYKFNSGIAYQLAKDYRKSSNTFIELINEGWTGEKTIYSAVLVETNSTVTFNSKDEMNKSKTLGIYNQFKEEKIPSKEENLYENLVLSLYNLEDYDNALKYLKPASSKFPGSKTLNELAGTIYHKTGQSDKFIDQLRKDISNDPNNENAIRNLAIMLTNKENQTEEEFAEAKNLYGKLIQMDANNLVALQNLTYLILKDDEQYKNLIDENIDQKNSTQKKIYDENVKKREVIYAEVLPYFKKIYELQPEDYNSVRNLRVSYGILGMFDEEDALLPKERELKKKARANK